MNDEWLKGYKAGEGGVFDYLKEMLPIDIKVLEEDYKAWVSADEYITFKGKKVNRCG